MPLLTQPHIWLPFDDNKDGNTPNVTSITDLGTSGATFDVYNNSGTAWSASQGWFQGSSSKNYLYSQDSTVISIMDYLNGCLSTGLYQGTGGKCMAMFFEMEQASGTLLTNGSFTDTNGEGYYLLISSQKLRYTINGVSSTITDFISGTATVTTGSTEKYCFTLDAQNRDLTTYRSNDTNPITGLKSSLRIFPSGDDREDYLENLGDVGLTDNGIGLTIGARNTKIVPGAPTATNPFTGKFRRLLVVDLSALSDPYQYLAPAASAMARWEEDGLEQDELPAIMTENW